MSELKEFTFGLGQYTEDGSPCVVAFDGERNPRLASDEKFYLKSEADKVIAELEEERRWRKFPEEKPTEDIKFLVINEKGFIQCCYYSPILKEFQIPVTHWMPLPSAPKEEN